MQDVWIVIPAFNEATVISEVVTDLRSVFDNVVCVDDGSRDETPARLRVDWPDVSCVSLEANRGFSAACNCGAREGSGEIIVLLNNDVECRPDFLERLTHPFGGNERVGSVASLLLQPGELRIESFGLVVDPTLAAANPGPSRPFVSPIPS